MPSHLTASCHHKFWGLGYYWLFWTAYFVILGDYRGILAALLSLAALPACLAHPGARHLLAGVFSILYLTLLYAGLPRLTLLNLANTAAGCGMILSTVFYCLPAPAPCDHYILLIGFLGQPLLLLILHGAYRLSAALHTALPEDT